MIRIAGAQPPPDEVAAIVAAISASLAPAHEPPRERIAPWKLADRRPDLAIEDLRARVRNHVR